MICATYSPVTRATQHMGVDPQTASQWPVGSGSPLCAPVQVTRRITWSSIWLSVFAQFIYIILWILWPRTCSDLACVPIEAQLVHAVLYISILTCVGDDLSMAKGRTQLSFTRISRQIHFFFWLWCTPEQKKLKLEQINLNVHLCLGVYV